MESASYDWTWLLGRVVAFTAQAGQEGAGLLRVVVGQVSGLTSSQQPYSIGIDFSINSGYTISISTWCLVLTEGPVLYDCEDGDLSR